MKNNLILIAISLVSLLYSCHKENNEPAIIGSYIGKSQYRSTRLTEIFTSPTQSKMVWVKDSTYQQPDTVVIKSISKDSFQLIAKWAGSLPSGWSKFSFADALDGTQLMFKRSFNISGYYQQDLLLQYDPITLRLMLDYHYSSGVPPRDEVLHYEGGK